MVVYACNPSTAPERLRQEDLKLEAILGYLVNSRPT
jgi:hypothetical protein